MLVGGSLSKKA